MLYKKESKIEKQGGGGLLLIGLQEKEERLRCHERKRGEVKVWLTKKKRTKVRVFSL